METTKLALLAELPGLEAAKVAIDARIEQIKKELTADGGLYLAPGERPPVATDPAILGRDVLGRIKRKRNLSPAVREQKRKLIALARQKKLDDLRTAAEQKSRIEPPHPPADTGAAEKKGQK